MILLQISPNPDNLPLTYLGYSLPIILLTIIALIKVALKWNQGRFPQGLRMIQGLAALAIIKLAAFSYIYLSWIGNPAFTTNILVADQAASLIGILIIFWFWNFPEPSKDVDPFAIALIGITLIISIAALSFFPELLSGLTGTILFWQGLSIVFLVLGNSLLFIRKPNLWVYGLFMGAILLLGSTTALLTGELDILRIFQLAAYPLLLILGDRFPIGEIPAEQRKGADQADRKRVTIDIEMLRMVQKLFDEGDPAGILYKIAKATAYMILADLTLIIDTPDEHGKMRIIAGYDLIREEPMQALTLDSRSIPLISNYIQRGKLLHIPASSTSRDLSHLSKMLQLTKPGHLLAAPVHVSGANKTIGVVLFSPFSNRPWTKEDQDYITILCKLFEAAFSHHLVSQDGESDSVKNAIRDLTSQLTQLTQDKHLLKDEIAVISKDHQNLLLDQDVLRTKYDRVLSRGNTLERHLAMLVDLSQKESTEALRKYVSVIEKELQRAQKSQDKAAAVPKVSQESEPEKVDPESTIPANLNEAIQSCLDSVQEELDKKSLAVTVELPDNTPLLKMNHALFQEIFSFLVDNALEETKPEGEIMIKTQIYEEDKSLHFAHIKVTDQGQGYFPDEIAAVLHDHLTTEQQNKLNQVMTNLYVTKNLIENEGGRMWVESKPGEGTTVSLLLAFL